MLVVDGRRLPVFLERFVRAPEPLEGGAAVVMGERETGIAAHGLVGPREGLGGRALPRLERAQIHLYVGVAGAQAVRFEEHPAGLDVLAARHRRVAGVQPGAGVLRRLLGGIPPERVVVGPGSVACEGCSGEPRGDEREESGEDPRGAGLIAPPREPRELPEAEARRGAEAEHREVGAMLVHGLGEREDRRLGCQGDDVPERCEGERRPAASSPPGEEAEREEREKAAPCLRIGEPLGVGIVEAIDHERVRPEEETQVVEVGRPLRQEVHPGRHAHLVRARQRSVRDEQQPVEDARRRDSAENG